MGFICLNCKDFVVVIRV